MRHAQTRRDIVNVLDANGIEYEVSETFEGVMSLRFAIDDGFEPGTIEDWYIQNAGYDHAPQWVIYSCKTHKEWQDQQGDNLAFKTKEAAQSYLNGFFDALETK